MIYFKIMHHYEHRQIILLIIFVHFTVTQHKVDPTPTPDNPTAIIAGSAVAVVVCMVIVIVMVIIVVRRYIIYIDLNHYHSQCSVNIMLLANILVILSYFSWNKYFANLSMFVLHQCVSVPCVVCSPGNLHCLHSLCHRAIWKSLYYI